MDLHQLLTIEGLTAAAAEFWDIIGPGGKLHPTYFLEHKGHLLVEALLLVVISYLVLQQAFKPKEPSTEQLTDKEIDQLCKEWKPEPLVPKPADDIVPCNTRIVSSYDGKYAVVDGKRILNMASMNFLGLSGQKAQIDVADATINKYGVGSCGPRGFYGTVDVHLQLEDQLAEFMGTQQAIIYSYDMATITSIIPAFANRKDTLVLDECCCFAVQQGATLSRAAVHWFKHNDMADLERVLKKIDAQDKKDKKPLNRRLLVVEGIYANTGELAPLDKLYQLKEKYKYRLVVEESHSFGVLGKTGKGAVEHWGLQPEQVEVVCASMGNSLGSVGGFCVGTEEIVEHQRLSGSGYCFSASLPPYLATAASRSLAVLREEAGQLLPNLQRAAAELRKALRELQAFQVVGSDNDMSPVIHLRLASQPAGGRPAAERLLNDIADHALKAGVLVCSAVYSELDRVLPPPSLVLYANAELSDDDVHVVANTLRDAAKTVL